MTMDITGVFFQMGFFKREKKEELEALKEVRVKLWKENMISCFSIS